MYLAFTILLLICTISVWRGIIGISDLYIFPNNKLISSMVSFTVGVGILWWLEKTHVMVVDISEKKIE
jgi:uncharacterized protein YjeT (DUF2065 family)